MAYLRHPNINWAGSDRPRAPADVMTATTLAILILHNATIVPLPVQPASALIPDPAVGYPTSG